VLPVYTYVTKRLVNPLLKGWESNVMDAHPSRQMYFVKAQSEEPETKSENSSREGAKALRRSESVDQQAGVEDD